MVLFHQGNQGYLSLALRHVLQTGGRSLKDMGIGYCTGRVKKKITLFVTMGIVGSSVFGVGPIVGQKSVVSKLSLVSPRTL